MDRVFRMALGIASLALLSGSAISQDGAAGYASLLGQWNPVRLRGQQPPALGTTASLAIASPVPGDQAVVVLGTAAGSGVDLFTPYNRNAYYLDPATPPAWVLVTPLSSGLGTLQLPVPVDPLLVGVDLAAQAWVLGPTEATASNLLVANLGTSAGVGMDFTLFQPAGGVLLRRAQTCADVFQNDAAAPVAVQVTFTLSEPSALAWSLRDGSQSGTLPPQTGPITLTVASVPAGTGIDICHVFGTSNLWLIMVRIVVP